MTADEIPGLSGITELRLLGVGGASSNDGEGFGLGEELVEENFGGSSRWPEGDADNGDQGSDVFVGEMIRGLSRT